MLLSNVLCLLSIVYGIFILCQLLSRSLSLIEFWVSHDLSLIFSAMSTSQSNRQASEFRTILSRINEIKTSLQGSDREEVSKKLDEMNDSLRIIEGNQADFSDAMFKAVERMQKSVEDGFKALESRIVALEARLDQSTDSTSALTSPTSSLLRKRKITRHPDLSVSEEPHSKCTLCLWYSMNFKHNC